MSELLLTSREAAVELLTGYYVFTDDRTSTTTFTEFQAGRIVDLLLTSGLIRDVATLADNTTLMRQVAKAVSDVDGCVYHLVGADVRVVLTALAAALAEPAAAGEES